MDSEVTLVFHKYHQVDIGWNSVSITAKRERIKFFMKNFQYTGFIALPKIEKHALVRLIFKSDFQFLR